ncbi:helix-turn-helix domain-containing protein [Streptomyces sp. TLI_146]|uniref:helix-turn-helix domain-containing protein n=1 Tax=Streptomyces sp. TLI_146 TaxID=1938858 RepID=UPI000CB34858|nr:helix-turn-helix domain-containing protein [Streptomyces sp. TLI_146]PKV89723.1 IclR family transcriptional regulator [Streptomyces sp. TLI_146]
MPRHTGPKPSAGRSVLEGAFLLLEVLSRVDEAGLTELAADAGLPKTTAHRLLEQLVAVGGVERSAGRYRIGGTIVRLGHSWTSHRVLGRAAALPLRHLAGWTGAAVALVAPVCGRMVIVNGLTGAADAAFSHRQGMVLPPGNAAEAVMAAAAPAAPPPPGQLPSEWEKRLRAAREHGAAVHRWGDDVVLSCVAAPVRTRTGKVVAAIGTTLPDSHRLATVTAATRHAARLTSANLARLPQARRL